MICDKELSSAAQLADHYRGRKHLHMEAMARSGGLFTCAVCDQTFENVADREKHMNTEEHKQKQVCAHHVDVCWFGSSCSMYHLSYVMCHVPSVICHMSPV